ncbi:unnamed protein product [Prorocentrum cordatum]|uniref:Uncharacterized protein n=1 Tax=Prorocentrum cordatum TaxID=2364126 RepID=A0ABN9RUT9_9DINO|nr:unnamed protein product [Polarella glacialis]
MDEPLEAVAQAHSEVAIPVGETATLQGMLADPPEPQQPAEKKWQQEELRPVQAAAASSSAGKRPKAATHYGPARRHRYACRSSGRQRGDADKCSNLGLYRRHASGYDI